MFPEYIWQREINENRACKLIKQLKKLNRPNHRPYDPKEIELIQYLCEQADMEFENEKKQ